MQGVRPRRLRPGISPRRLALKQRKKLAGKKPIKNTTDRNCQKATPGVHKSGGHPCMGSEIVAPGILSSLIPWEEGQVRGEGLGVALWKAFYIENQRFYLDTLPNRSPTPISKSNDFLGQSGYIWGALGPRFRPSLGVPGVRAVFKKHICLSTAKRQVRALQYTLRRVVQDRASVPASGSSTGGAKDRGSGSSAGATKDRASGSSVFEETLVTKPRVCTRCKPPEKYIMGFIDGPCLT